MHRPVRDRIAIPSSSALPFHFMGGRYWRRHLRKMKSSLQAINGSRLFPHPSDPGEKCIAGWKRSSTYRVRDHKGNDHRLNMENLTPSVVSTPAIPWSWLPDPGPITRVPDAAHRCIEISSSWALRVAATASLP